MYTSVTEVRGLGCSAFGDSVTSEGEGYCHERSGSDFRHPGGHIQVCAKRVLVRWAAEGSLCLVLGVVGSIGFRAVGVQSLGASTTWKLLGGGQKYDYKCFTWCCIWGDYRNHIHAGIYYRPQKSTQALDGCNDCTAAHKWPTRMHEYFSGPF